MIGKYPIVVPAERTALARAVARARRMQECLTDRAHLADALTPARDETTPRSRSFGRQTDGQVDVARGTAPDPGGERVRAGNVGLAAGFGRSWS